MKKLAIIFLAFTLMGAERPTPTPQLRDTDTVSMIKASYIYNFAKLISWPSNREKGNFTIGLLGDPGLHQQMITKYAGKQVGDQDIEIVLLGSADKIGDPHILYVNRKNNDVNDEIIKALEKKSTMIITEDPTGLSKGATLNFIVVNNMLKFEISEENAAKRNLSIANTLLSLAHKN